jgi:hypothetical protein
MDMDNIAKIAENADIGLKTSNISRNINVGQNRISLSLGPFLPILSGNYNIVAIETSDFQSFSVTSTSPLFSIL